MASKSFDKLIEEIGNMSVLDLSDFVKALEDKFGVSAAMPVAAAAAPAAVGAEPAQAEEKSEYKVILKTSGPEKIKTIKALRKVTSLGLGEAKKAVEEAPTVIGEAVPKDDAMNMKKELEAVDAEVELA